MEAESLVQSETASQPMKDHCDYLMDSIDAQLSQLQVSILSVHGQRTAGSLTDSISFRNTAELSRRTGTLNRSQSGSRDTGLGSTSAADPLSDTEVPFSLLQKGTGVSECEDRAGIFSSPTGAQHVTAASNPSPGFRRCQANTPLAEPGRQEAEADGESRKKQYEWRVQQLLGPQQMENQGYHSDTNTVDSVCTEDFASRFHEGMVDPALNFDTEPGSDGSFTSGESLGDWSQESTSLYPEPNSEHGNLGSEACGLPRDLRLFRRKQSNREFARRDHLSRRDRSGARSKTSARSPTSAERDGCIGCGSLQGEGDNTVADGPVNSAAQSSTDLQIVQQFREELEQVLQRTRSQAGTSWAEQAASRALPSRTESVESLGGRISKLSQNNMSEQTSQRRNIPSGNRILTENPSKESPENPNPLKENNLVTGYSSAPNPGIITHKGLGTNIQTTGIKLKGTLKRLSQGRERLSRNLNPELEGLSTGDTSNLIPVPQQSLAPSDKPLPGDNQQDAVAVNRNPSPRHVTPTLVPHCTGGASSSPAHDGNDPGKTNISGQWNGMTESLSGFGSQTSAADSFTTSPMCLSGSNPPPVPSLWKGSGSELAPDRRADVARSAVRPKRKQSLDLPQSKLTGSVHVTKPKLTHARSNTDGGYREELGSLREKPLSHRTVPKLNGDVCGKFGLQSSLNIEGTGSVRSLVLKHVAGVPMTSFDDITVDSDLDSVRTEKVQTHFQKILKSRNGGRGQIVAGVSGSRPVKKCCSPRKETVRYTSSEKTITVGEDFEELFGQLGTEFRSSSPTKWKEWADCPWDRNRGPEMSSSHRVLYTPPSNTPLFWHTGSPLNIIKDLSVEEEQLIQRKSQLREADQTLPEVLQQKEHAVQDAESLKETVEKGQRDARALETRLRETRSEADQARTEQVEFKRDGYLQELRDLEGELGLLNRHSTVSQSNARGRMQNEVTSLILECDNLRAHLLQLEGSLSFLEHQELERQLKSTKDELLTEQRSTRVRSEELHQQLEKSQLRLEQRTAEVTQLLEKNRSVESQVRELERSLQAERADSNSNNLNRVRELSMQLTERDLKVNALQEILSEMEMEQLRLRETVVVLREEKEAQLSAMETLRKEHERQLAVTTVEKQWEQLSEINRVREELKIMKDEELMELKTKFEEERAQTLKDQELLLTQEAEKHVKKLQAMHEETLTLRERIRTQEESTKKLSEELKQEAKEMVQHALVQEHKKWELDQEEQLRQQCLSLEEENGRVLNRANEDLEKERRCSLALQNKIVELQKKIQELEFQSRSLHREKDQAVSNVRTLLTEEKRKEIQQLREEMQLEKKHDVERLTSKLDQMEEELRSLRAENNEAVLKEREAQVQAERAERTFVSEIKMECERIQVLIQSTQARASGRVVSPSCGKLGSPTRMTLGQAIHTLRGAGEDLHQLVMDLHQELESRRRAAHHLQREKEREIKQQQEQLLLEKEEALAALKDRLIQDHIEEVSKLQRSQQKDSGGGEVLALRQQLWEKDNELRAIQRNVAKWKDETACKLARKFEEELDAELEKHLSKNRSEHQRKIEKLENEICQLSLVHRETAHLRSVSTPSMASSAVASFRQQDFGTLKLLRHLQSRVKQLRAENIIYHGASLEDMSTLQAESGSSCREMSRVTPERSLPCFAGKSSRK
ncbi:uncharacterized protein si:ch211-102c2.8 [Heptranchias perlo]|uniref:uncharacterized protein si:ch211-102c2.8 n=1 Tax=Heptranchias perlo TaxID=212740 RepID=UPI00355ACAC7